jgi:aminoglycoside phosphotransferase (APT) family kinase protein
VSTAPPPPPAIDEAYATRCLVACGLRGRVSDVVPCAGGITNANYKVSLVDGRNVLLRLYRWPHAEPDLERGRKEAFLHDLLLRNRVPVPTVHGFAPDGSCSVMEWIDGVRLRDAVGTADGDLSSAWAEAGAALRLAHGLQPFDRSGVITGGRLEPFDVSWGEFHADLIRRHGRSLRDLDRINDAQLARIEAASGTASSTLATEPQVRLLHNDPHGSNVLVRKEGAQWRLAAWIDWEYAWMGDPEWDLARFQIFTTAQAGLVEDAFWAGYGGSPDPAKFPFYELHAMAWLGSLRNPRPTALTAAARAYVDQIDAHLDALGV